MVFSKFNCLNQGKINSIESKLNEALHSSDGQSTLGSETGSGTLSNSKAIGDDGTDSNPVTRKLEEELKKRDALIEVCCSTII